MIAILLHNTALDTRGSVVKSFIEANNSIYCMNVTAEEMTTLWMANMQIKEVVNLVFISISSTKDGA